MEITRIFFMTLFLLTLIYDNVLCTNKQIDSYEMIHEGEKYRVYLEGSDRKCLWTGNAPFCFISGRCPPGMTTIKMDKHGDGAFCWVGSKAYCCLISFNATKNTN